MVRRNPEPIANQSYFTRIVLSPATPADGMKALAALGRGLDLGSSESVIYRLDVGSVSDKEVTLYLFDFPNDQPKWGIWCTEKCDPSSRFMLLDMNKKL
jgi:hypothetical protein